MRSDGCCGRVVVHSSVAVQYDVPRFIERLRIADGSDKSQRDGAAAAAAAADAACGFSV